MRGSEAAGLVMFILIAMAVVIFFATGIWAGVSFYSWLSALLVGSGMAGALAAIISAIGGFFIGVVVGKVCTGIYVFVLGLLGVSVSLSLGGRSR